MQGGGLMTGNNLVKSHAPVHSLIYGQEEILGSALQLEDHSIPFFLFEQNNVTCTEHMCKT